jgi:hypothetical protein|tara:strand:+ start:296 stop:544 length:249 start_codon:yes stop_codon:yes gene_type:complete
MKRRRLGKGASARETGLDALTVTNAVPTPELVFDEGRAIVWSRRPEIGVSARVYYTAGDGDERLHAITDSKVVVYGGRNSGD